MAGGLIGAPRPAAAVDEALAPFFHGVASGDPGPTSVVLWTRVTVEGAGDVVPLRWEVARDLEFADVVATGTVDARATEDYTVKPVVDGLEPFTYHYYRFCLGDVPSITGRTKTAPAAGQAVDRLRFGFVSCSNYEGGYFNAYARLADRNDMDAIVCAGDYIYEYGQGGYGPGAEIGRVTEPPDEMVTLDQYRGRFAHYRLDPDLRRLHQLYPWINTWDDHETTNDSWRDGAENHNDGEGDWEARKATAWKAYREWLPLNIDATDPAAPIELYRSLDYGDLADLVVMDTRIEGRDEAVFAVLEPGLIETAIDDPARRMISPAQEDFVASALGGSDAAWKIVLQQVMVMQWRMGALPEAIGDTSIDFISPVVTAGGNSVNGDAWDGYAAERKRLFAHLRDNEITDVVVLTGDIHTTWAAELTEDPWNPLGYDVTGMTGLAPRALGVEFVTPSVTSDNVDEILIEQGMPAELALTTAAALEAATLVQNPHIKSVDLVNHGYAIIDITAERLTYDTFFVPTLEPSDVETFHESWYVEKSAGTAGLSSADAGHKLAQGTEPTASRTDVAAAPDALPVEKATAAPPTTAAPTAGGGGALPATGTAVPLTAGIAVAAAAIALRRRRSGES